MAEGTSRVLAGRYEVGELIGRGGMAEVHIGRDTRLGRTVAIKVLRSDLARDPTFQARFRREAQSAASLNHPAIVSVYDTGEDTSTDAHGDETHVPFIVMEYVEGHTVRDLVRDGAALPIDEAVEITAGVLSALEYSHRAGIVHRDIKPANVMLTPTGDVKVMDFGIARAMADASGAMTQTQAVVGTAQYLSPEQARGEVVDTRSDLYSTGCLLYELLTGRPPFQGDSAVSVAYQHVSEAPALPSAIAPDVPEELDRIVMKALAKDRDERYGTADEFRADLEAAAGNGVVSAPPIGAATTVLAGAAGPATQVFGGTPPAVTPATRAEAKALADEEEEEPKRNTALIWILSVIGVLAVVAIVWLLLTRGDNPPDEPDPTTATEVMVTIPELEGLTQGEITQVLAAEGLTAEFTDPQADDTIPAGEFLSSTPPPGQQVDISDEAHKIVTVTLSAGPSSVKVPALDGMNEAEIRAALEDVGLTANFQTEANDDVEEGLFVRSDPAPGASVDVTGDGETTIEVWLSDGPGSISVPDVSGMSQEEARQTLIDAGFDAANFTVTTENVAGSPQGEANRTEPAAGESAAPDDPITIVLATGNVTLPDLSGVPEQEALDQLAALKLNNGITRVHSGDFDEGVVITTSPGPGDIAYDRRVELTISLGPPPDDPGNGNGGDNGGGNGGDEGQEP